MRIFSSQLSKSMTMGVPRTLARFKPELNTVYRIFFPQSVQDGEAGIGVVTVASRQLEKDACNTYSYVYGDDDLQITDEEKGLWEDLTPLATMAKMAFTIHEAAYVAEVCNKELELQRVAQETGLDYDPHEFEKARELLDKQYHGSKNAYETVDNRKYPVIRGAKLATFTEIIAIPTNADGIPDYSKAGHYYWPISRQRQEKLNRIYIADSYEAKSAEKPYIETSFKFLGENKAQAGQKAEFGFIPEYLSLEKKNEADWKLYGEPLLEELARGTFEEIAEKIAEKCPMCHNYETLDTIWQCFQKWCANSKTSIAAIAKLNPDMIVKSFDVIMQIPTLKDLPAIKAKVKDIYMENKSDSDPSFDEIEASLKGVKMPVATKTKKEAPKPAKKETVAEKTTTEKAAEKVESSPATAFDSLSTIEHVDKKDVAGPLSKVDPSTLSDDDDLGDI